MSGYKVVPAAVRAESTKWKELSDRVAPIARAVQGADLSVTAFFVGDPMTMSMTNTEATLHWDAYRDFLALMRTVLTDAVREFQEIAGALKKTADIYDQSDEHAQLDLNDIYRVRGGRS